jgi:MFS transporter, FHS family, glucose/mannose:H+ symporter
LKFVSSAVILRASLSIAFIGSLVLIFSGAPGIAVIGLILVGFGFAAVFPVIFAYVGDLYSKLSGTAFSVVLVMALTGGMLYPYGTGILANSYGLKVALLLFRAVSYVPGSSFGSFSGVYQTQKGH